MRRRDRSVYGSSLSFSGARQRMSPAGSGLKTWNNLHLSEAFGVAGDGSAAKEKIEKLIKEIDKCISLLEN